MGRQAPKQVTYHILFFPFLLGGTTLNHSWGRKGGTPALRLAWHFSFIRMTMLDRFTYLKAVEPALLQTEEYLNLC